MYGHVYGHVYRRVGRHACTERYVSILLHRRLRRHGDENLCARVHRQFNRYACRHAYIQVLERYAYRHVLQALRPQNLLDGHMDFAEAEVSAVPKM